MASPSEDRSRRLVVVGAAAGIGRWLSEHVLSLPAVRHLWASVTLLDTPEAVTKLISSPGFESTIDVIVAAVGAAGPPADVDLSAPNTVAIVAVPLDTLVDVAAWVSARLHRDALIIDTSHDRSRAVAAWSGRTNIGLHPLFGVTAPSAAGQTFALCTPVAPPLWLVNALEAAGGNVNVMTDEHHDTVMATVQTASHQALLTFADVVGRSGLDLEDDLWANRTPVFELLLALAVRVLAPGQDATTSSIQEADLDHRALDSLRSSVERLSAAGDSDTEGDNGLAAHLASLRAPFSGGLFTKISQAGALATSAVQSSRARIAEVRQAGELIGVRTIGSDSDRLHVGRITRVTPTSFTLSSALVGSKGNAALLSDDTATVNARRLGIAGKSKSVEFRLGRVDILSPSELDHELDSWLATVTRGCKFLIPESISGRSAVRVVQGVFGVSGAELISEEVRLGQREVVVRFTARLDRDLPDVERRIIERVDEVFVWPDGVVLALARAASRIGFLGPAGTFSDVACRQLIRLISGSNTASEAVERIEYPEFVDMIAALENGSVDLAVLPITNSSSGLVDLAAGVLATSSPLITAGGVVDVPVRFDAYISSAFASGLGSESFNGAKVYSHPQGFRQCSQFVAAHRLVEVVCSSTAEACRMVAENNDGVALAATGMNTEFGLVTARTSVGNLAGALTRFLVLGKVGSFEAPVRADALQRTVWIIESEVAGRLPVRTQPRYDEVLRGPSGRTLLVSTDPLRVPPDTVGARLVATIPWSPRTPLVVIE
jgi:prephenate dehydratase/prephenate dehydrogenase